VNYKIVCEKIVFILQIVFAIVECLVSWVVKTRFCEKLLDSLLKGIGRSPSGGVNH